MIFGAIIIGVGVGLVTMTTSLVMGASLGTALLLYCGAGVAGTVGACVLRAYFCSRDAKPSPRPASLRSDLLP